MVTKFSTIKLSSIIILIFNIIWSLHLYFLNQCTHFHHNHDDRPDYSYRHLSLSSLLVGNSSLHMMWQNYQMTVPMPNNKVNLLKKYLKGTNYYDSLHLEFHNISLTMSRWDNKRVYKIIDFALVGDNYEKSSLQCLVCMATQTSVERMHSLAEASKQWKAPISVGVFVAGSEEFIILQYYVTYLRLCFDFVRANVTFHLAYPYQKQPNREIFVTYKLLQMFDCQYPERTLRSLLTLRTTETKRWRIRNVYPQNHMRNLARKGCQTKYVFLTDVDIIPSTNIVPKLNNFLSTVQCANKLCAFVIPTFEIDERVRFPDSKKALLRLVRKGLARSFHEKVFIYNQYATNFSSWLANANDNEQVSIAISHKVTNYEFLYEPFYVASDSVPPHDERFLGYGFTRNTQVYEMYVAGYTFFVLTPVFTCHWGLQRKNSRPSWREQQNTLNRRRFETFKKEILVRYRKH